ncbi:MAG: hypothetical protein AB7S38_00735 [Vulcanimicrobiota bacterium]
MNVSLPPAGANLRRLAPPTTSAAQPSTPSVLDSVEFDSAPPTKHRWLKAGLVALGAVVAVGAAAAPAQAQNYSTIAPTGHPTYFGTIPGPVSRPQPRSYPGAGYSYSLGPTGAYIHRDHGSHGLTVGPNGAYYHGNGYTVGPHGAIPHSSIYRGNGYSIGPWGTAVHRNFGHYSITVGPQGTAFHFHR